MLVRSFYGTVWLFAASGMVWYHNSRRGMAWYGSVDMVPYVWFVLLYKNMCCCVKRTYRRTPSMKIVVHRRAVSGTFFRWLLHWEDTSRVCGVSPTRWLIPFQTSQSQK